MLVCCCSGILLPWWGRWHLVLQCSCWTVGAWTLALVRWPFCLLSSCFVDGSLLKDEKLLFISMAFILLSIPLPPPPHPPTPSLPLHKLSSSFSLSFPVWLFYSPPSPALLHPLLSFPAKRLAGVFSAVVTFKTECHHCLSRSVSSLALTCLSLCHPPPLHLPPPSSSCSEGLLDQVLCLEERLALIQLPRVCVCWVFCVD